MTGQALNSSRLPDRDYSFSKHAPIGGSSERSWPIQSGDRDLQTPAPETG